MEAASGKQIHGHYIYVQKCTQRGPWLHPTKTIICTFHMALCLVTELFEFNGGFGQGDTIKKSVNLSAYISGHDPKKYARLFN